MAIRDIVQAAAGNGKEPTYVEDVFSTALYTGNGNVQAVNNDIALGSAYGGSVYFNGTNSYLSAPDNAVFDFGSGNFTIEFWVYLPQDPGLYYPYFAKRSGGTYEPVSLLSGATERNLRLLCSTTGSGWEVDLTSSVDLSLRTWTHVAVTRNGNVFTIWINGVNRGTQTTSGSLYVTTAPFYISYDPGTNRYLKAYISNFRVVKGTAVYTSTFTPSTSPLTNVSGTALLTCQAPNLTTDNSSNAFSLTAVSTSSFSGYGPFTDAALAEGGMVWIKSRAVNYNIIYDTVRGPSLDLYTDYAGGTYQETANPEGLNEFNSGGFRVGNYSGVNASNEEYASWTFGIAKKFFDVVTWTGNGVAGRQIPHNLGSVPGCIIIKCRTGSNEPWYVYHRSLGPTKHLTLNTTNAENTSEEPWYNTAPTSTNFTVAQYNSSNGSGKTYVAYLFAHDAGGFGDGGTDNVISCGSFTASSGAATVNLGWEPQWILYKRSDSTDNWKITDNMRGMFAPITNGYLLYPNLSNAEAQASGAPYVTPTGFSFDGTNNGPGSLSGTYVYIAVRRGPMQTPTVGTDVYYSATQGAGGNLPDFRTTFPVDWGFYKNKVTAGTNWVAGNRLTSDQILRFNTTGAQATVSSMLFDYQNGWFGANVTSSDIQGWSFRRAPGFFDVVTYTGNGASNRAIQHNLGVAPEFIIQKCRDNSTIYADWIVYHKDLPDTYNLVLNLTSAQDNNNFWAPESEQTSSVFKFGSTSLPASYEYTNYNNKNYIVYLFASCPGVSSVGSVNVTGSTINVNCGFTNGARFIMLKRSSGTSPWLVWDSSRGIVAGNDPYLAFNNSSAQDFDGAADLIDPYSPGFTIVGGTFDGLFGTGTFIYLAIA